MSTTNDVRAASGRFYAALNSMANGDAASMGAVWVQSDLASTQHPIGGRELGYDAVMASFAKVAGIAGGGEIRLTDQAIDVGSDMAVETGVEVGNIVIGGHDASIHHRVTNVYRQVNGQWRLAHHHTDLSPAMLEILGRLTNAA
jgi:ketosteroid isomerase-like protein